MKMISTRLTMAKLASYVNHLPICRRGKINNACACDNVGDDNHLLEKTLPLFRYADDKLHRGMITYDHAYNM